MKAWYNDATTNFLINRKADDPMVKPPKPAQKKTPVQPPKNSEWIDVRDELPPHMLSVVIWLAEDGALGEDFVDCGCYNAVEKRWQVSAGMDDEVVTNVSHWLRVPPGPWFKVSDRKPHDHPDVEFNGELTEWRYC